MARSLNLREARVFSEEILPTDKLPLIDDSAEALLKHVKTLEPALDPGLWICSHFSGPRES
jgi:hypothetical protein